jgi:hypothetical protein
MPSIIRTRTGSPPRGGMQSVSLNTPEAVPNSVCKVSVSGR